MKTPEQTPKCSGSHTIVYNVALIKYLYILRLDRPGDSKSPEKRNMPEMMFGLLYDSLMDIR